MRLVFRIGLLLLGLAFLSSNVWSQAGDICGEAGAGGTVWLNMKVVYGRITLVGTEISTRLPKVTVTLVSGARMTVSTNVNENGSYCFRDVDGSGATLIVEVEGREVGRQDLEPGTATMPKQFRRDFEIQLSRDSSKSKPGVISAKYPYNRQEPNSKLYSEAESALNAKDLKVAERNLTLVVTSDKGDFWAWAKLGSIFLERTDLPAAEKAFNDSLKAKSDFLPAMISLGQVYLLQKRFDTAIETLLESTKLEPNSARAFRLLGEAYLMVRKGSLGVEALNEAIRLDPVGMAECHLLIALLYDRAGAKSYAAREYKLFLEKKPEHPDAKKFAKYIQDNPAEP